jgi:hypothetical protein
VVLKALVLEESKGAIAFVDSRLEGFPQVELGPGELNP